MGSNALSGGQKRLHGAGPDPAVGLIGSCPPAPSRDVSTQPAATGHVRYLGWQAFLDGQSVPIRVGHPLKVIEIDVPAGVHEVRVIFAPTWDRRLGATVSLGATTVLLGLCLWAMNRKRLQSEAKG